MFLRDENTGEHVSTKGMLSFRRCRDVVIWTDRSGEVRTTDHDLFEKQEDGDFEIVSVVPAEPRTFCIYTDKGEVWLGDHILAWAITDNGYTYAITSEGKKPFDNNLTGILFPDGQVECPFVSTHESLEAYTEIVKNEYLTSQIKSA